MLRCYNYNCREGGRKNQTRNYTDISIFSAVFVLLHRGTCHAGVGAAV